MKIKYSHKMIRKGLGIIVMLLPIIGNSQASPPPIPPPPPPGLPIDGGIGFLLIAGVFYGIKKYKDNSS